MVRIFGSITATTVLVAVLSIAPGFALPIQTSAESSSSIDTGSAVVSTRSVPTPAENNHIARHMARELAAGNVPKQRTKRTLERRQTDGLVEMLKRYDRFVEARQVPNAERRAREELSSRFDSRATA